MLFIHQLKLEYYISEAAKVVLVGKMGLDKPISPMHFLGAQPGHVAATSHLQVSI